VRFPAKLWNLLLLGLLLTLPLHRAQALLNFDGTRNQIFAFGHLTFGYSSNIFSDSTQRGDSNLAGEVGLEWDRRAGAIAVNAIAKIGYEHFFHFTDENSTNPFFSLELVKGEGRATGSFMAGAFRESRSDSAINIRTRSWNYPLTLKIRYPFSDRFYGTSQTGYLRRTYSADTPQLLNYRDYSEALDLFYIYTSKLDLVGGYRVRLSNVVGGPDTYDHWFSVGATGALLAKLNGSIRFGYEIRDIDTGPSYNHFNVVAAVNWTVTRKLTLTGQLSRDFNTLATGASVDTTLAALRANYSVTRKFEIEGGVAYGRNKFLNGNLAARRDDFFTADIGAHYKFNEHLRVGASYAYLRNWSTLDFSDFDRSGFSVDIASRF